MSRINAAIVFGIRKQLALYREQLATGNPDPGQLVAIREKLTQLTERIQPLIAERRWEAQEVSRELDELARQVQYRIMGRDSRARDASIGSINVLLNGANQNATIYYQLAIPLIDRVRASRMNLQTINLTQDGGRYWFPLITGTDELVPITLTVHRQDLRIASHLGSENICHQDGGQWFSHIGLPAPMSHTSRQAMTDNWNREINDEVPTYYRRPTGRSRPQFLWFSRLPAAAAGGGQQYRYQCWLNRDQPWTNFGRLQQSAPVWYNDGPVVQVGLLEEYDQLVESVNQLADYCRTHIDLLNELLAKIDLAYRIQRQQLPADQRQLLEQKYREVMARLLAVRNHLRDQYRTLNDSAQQQLRLFSTPGAGGLLICRY